MAKKQKELFIIVAGETPYIGRPEERESKHTYDSEELPTNLKEAKTLLKLWQAWDAEIGGIDDPPMDFKIYKLESVE